MTREGPNSAVSTCSKTQACLAHRPHDPETEIVVPDVAGVPEAAHPAAARQVDESNYTIRIDASG